MTSSSAAEFSPLNLLEYQNQYTLKVPNCDLQLVPLGSNLEGPHIGLIKKYHEYFSKYIFKFRKEEWEKNELVTLQGAEKDWKIISSEMENQHSESPGKSVPSSINFAIMTSGKSSSSSQDQMVIIGVVGLLRLDATKKQAEIGYYLDPDYASKGYMTLSCAKLLDALWMEGRWKRVITLDSILLHTATFNQASMKLGVRLGFSLAGEDKEKQEIWYTLTEEQWKAARKDIQTRDSVK